METNHLIDPRIVEQFIADMGQSNDDKWERDRWHAQVTIDQFVNMIQSAAGSVMRLRGTYSEFVCDDNNSEIITNLYYYFIGDQESCTWNVDKGIYMYGKIGCGKTLLMSAFLKVVAGMCRIVTTTIHAKQIYERIQKKGIESMVMCPLFIDELGRESLEINEFGNKIRPIQDLFAMRYESGARTFCTSNFSTEQLEGKIVDGVQKGYGKYVRTRMEEMMNIVKLPGENRRPIYTL